MKWLITFLGLAACQSPVVYDDAAPPVCTSSLLPDAGNMQNVSGCALGGDEQCAAYVAGIANGRNARGMCLGHFCWMADACTDPGSTGVMGHCTCGGIEACADSLCIVPRSGGPGRCEPVCAP